MRCLRGESRRHPLDPCERGPKQCFRMHLLLRLLPAAGVFFGAAWGGAEAVLALVPPRSESEAAHRRELLGTIADILTAEDPLAATRWLARIADPDQLASVRRTVADEWARRDPAAAYRWALSLPGAAAQEAPLLRVAERWLGTDATATFAALDQPPASTRQLVLPGILSQYASEDPADAALRAARLPAGPERQRVFDEILRRWTETAPEQARAWARRNQREFTPPVADR